MDDDAGGCVGELGSTYCGAPVFMHVAEAEDVWPLESGQAGRQADSVSVVAIRYAIDGYIGTDDTGQLNPDFERNALKIFVSIKK